MPQTDFDLLITEIGWKIATDKVTWKAVTKSTVLTNHDVLKYVSEQSGIRIDFEDLPVRPAFRDWRGQEYRPSEGDWVFNFQEIVLRNILECQCCYRIDIEGNRIVAFGDPYSPASENYKFDYATGAVID